MRHTELMHILDNLRLYNITGSHEFMTAARGHFENLIWLEESEIKILEMNGFKIEHGCVYTNKGRIPLPSSNG